MRVLAWPASSAVSGNAYNSLLSEAVERADGSVEVAEFSLRRALTEHWDVWHVHWPDYLLATPSRVRVVGKLVVFALLLRWLRLRRTRVVWTVHNLGAHLARHPSIERRFLPWFAARVDGAIALTERGAELALERFPALRQKPLAVIPHGHYLDAYPNEVRRREARSALSLAETATCIAFVGRISAYKNVPALLREFSRLPDPSLRLLIAGDVSEAGEGEAIRVAAAADPRVLLHLRAIADDELQLFLNAADLVVLPYRTVLNSASALLALSFLRPVLVPAQGSLGELQQEVGEGWVRLYTGELTAEVLRRAACVPAPAPGELVELLRDRLDWDEIGAQTGSFYNGLVAA